MEPTLLNLSVWRAKEKAAQIVEIGSSRNCKDTIDYTKSCRGPIMEDVLMKTSHEQVKKVDKDTRQKTKFNCNMT